MGNLGNKAISTVYNYGEMQIVRVKFASVMGGLLDAYEKSSTLLQSFAADYEGEAVGEVSIFLAKLPDHIERLMKLYFKMQQFISQIELNFQLVDSRMVQNMEN